jgi:hypothetical protein
MEREFQKLISQDVSVRHVTPRKRLGSAGECDMMEVLGN